MKTLILLIFLSCHLQSIFSQQWNQFGSCGWDFWPIAPAGNSVYVGGSLPGCDPDANYLALWDSCQWSAMPVVNGYVSTIAVLGNDVYIGGSFTEPFSYLARWDGTQWNSVGSAPIAPVYEILIDGPNLIIAGESFVSQWNGSSWETLGTFNGPVRSLTKDGNFLYAAGDFTDAGGNPDADYIAKYDGTTWNNLGVPGSNIVILDILNFNSELYVAGCFENIGGNPDADNVAKWDGANWIGLNFPSGYCGRSLTVFQGTIFSAADNNGPYAGIYEWDAGAGEWEVFASIILDVGPGWISWLIPLASDADNLYIGEDFWLNGEFYSGMARWGPPDGCVVCPTLNATGEITNPLCAGSSNGFINLTPPNNGSPPYSYTWSNGATTEDISGLSAGNYSLTISDGLSCETTFSFGLTEPPETTLNMITQPVSCYGEGDGELTAIPSGGTPSYGYLWSNGENAATINNLEPGIYFVTVTDSNGCTQTGNAEVESPPAILLSFSGQDVSCFGASDGSASTTVTGGTSGYSYLWSNGSNTGSINNVIADNYEVTVTDNTGCTFEGSYTIESPTELDVVISVIDVSAPGAADGFASAQVNGGTPVYYYLWSTGEFTESISGLEPGNYTLTVTDENGCSEEVFFTISTPDCGLSVSIAIDLVTCYGNQDGAATAEYSGGSGNIEFLWSTGDTSQTISNLGAGTYSVTITDANCIAISSAILTDPSAIDVQVTSEPTACNEATGSATVAANGGTGPSSFLWSNGETTNEIDSLIAGIYSVTVSDTVGCSINMSITVLSVDSVAPVMIQAIDTMYVNATGAIDDFTSLADNFLDDCGTFNYETLNAGELSCQQQQDTLHIQVTDISGNGQVYDVFITLLDTFPPQFVTCPASIEQGTCQGEVVYIDPVASDNCQVGEMIQTAGLPSGSEFPVGTTINEWLATDLNGNTQQCSQVVIIAEGIVLETAVQPITCHEHDDGLITINTNLLTPPYSIVWSTGDTTATLHDLSEGNYSVIVTDDNGCQGMDTFSLANPELLFASLQGKQDVSSADANDGFIIINVSGGTMPYTYEWKQGDTLVSNQQNPDSLGPGLYTLFLRDTHQCLFIGLEVAILITGTKDITDGQLRIWPNPSRDFFFIESPYIMRSWMLYNMSGQLLKSQDEINATTFHINLKDLRPGLYALVMISGEGSGKIVRALIAKVE